MRHLAVFLVILALCMQIFPVSAEIIPPVEFSLTVDKQSVCEGESVSISVFVNSEVEISGGSINLNLSSADVFNEPQTEFLLELEQPVTYNSQNPIASFSLDLAESIIGVDEEQIEIIVSLSTDTYLTIAGENLSAPDGISQTITVLPLLIVREIKTYCELKSADGFFVTLNNKTKPEEEPINAIVSFEDEKLLFSFRKSAVSQQDNYTATISGDGYIGLQTDFMLDSQAMVNGFYPGGLNADDKIDLFDFNLLCSFISYRPYNIIADLNRDGAVDQEDIQCYINGYKAKRGQR